MRNEYTQRLKELKASFIKALIFCIAFNAIFVVPLLAELAIAIVYDPSIGIGDVLIILVGTLVPIGWLISFIGFSIVNYRYTKNPMASIWECLNATISGKKPGLPYAWKGPLNAMEILGSIRDLKSMAAAENKDNAVFASYRSAEF